MVWETNHREHREHREHRGVKRTALRGFYPAHSLSIRLCVLCVLCGELEPSENRPLLETFGALAQSEHELVPVAYDDELAAAAAG